MPPVVCDHNVKNPAEQSERNLVSKFRGEVEVSGKVLPPLAVKVH
jgi:hypothetical protein